MANLGKAFLSAIGKVAANSPLGENTEAGIEEFESNQDPLYISYYRQEGVHPEASKSGTCNYCLAMNGHMFRRSQLLQDDGSLGHHPGCVTGDTDVAIFHGDAVQAETRRKYYGKLICIEADGFNMKLTPNHPVLTEKGFVSAAAIKAGDRIITGAKGFTVSGYTKAEDLFNEFDTGKRYLVKSSASDFHGDGKDDHDDYTEVIQFFEYVFPGFNYKTAKSFPPVEIYKGAKLRAISKGSEDWFNPDEFSAISVDSVTETVIEKESPIYVYNFETVYGMFLCGGFVTHNCKCTFVPVANEEAFFQGNPAKGPIEMTGEEVWQNPRARKGVGAKRLAQIPNKTLKEVLKKRNLAVGGNKTALLGRIFKGWL